MDAARAPAGSGAAAARRRQEYYEEPEYQPSPVHPLHRYAAQHAAPEPQYQQPQYQHPQYEQPQYQDEQHYAEPGQQPDPSRYDDALYGQIEAGQDYQRDPAYPDDPYAYQSGYEEEPEEPRKRGGLITVVAVLALAVVGTGGAFAYRNFRRLAAQRRAADHQGRQQPDQGRAGRGPKVRAKAPDRMAIGDGTEKLVPREETPVDVNARSGPRVVFPPLNQNANPPTAASVAPGAAAAQARRTAHCRTTSRAGSGRSRSRVMHADAGVPADAAPPPAGLPRRPPARLRQRRRPRPRRVARHRPMPAPMRRSRCRRRRTAGRRRAAGPGRRGQPGCACRQQQWRWLRRPGLLAEERGGCAGLVPGAAEQVPGGAGLPRAADQAR